MPLLATPPGDSTSRFVEQLRQMFISGAAITIPAVVTLVVLAFAVNFILGLISPVVTVAADVFSLERNVPEEYMEALAVLTLLATVFAVGFVAETRSGDGLERAFDTAMARIPGVGSVYTSFNEMSKMLLSNDTQSFREVKLVEFPTAGAYTVAFVTADTPEVVNSATGNEEMTTLFMPMAPNPVMGGFVIHVTDERVHDVDLTVEEGIRSIVTSGVATGEARADHDGELVDFDGWREQARSGVAGIEAPSMPDAEDIREMTPEELADFSARTREEFGVIWSADEEDGDDRVHYMVDRTADDPPIHEVGTDARPDTGGDGDGDRDTGPTGGRSDPVAQQRPESAETADPGSGPNTGDGDGTHHDGGPET